MLSLRDDYLDLTFDLKVLGFFNETDTNLDTEITIQFQGKVILFNAGSFMVTNDIEGIHTWLHCFFKNSKHLETNLYLKNSNLSFHHLSSDEDGIHISVGLHDQLDVEPDFFESVNSKKISKELERKYYTNPFESGSQMVFYLKWKEISGILKNLKKTTSDFVRYEPIDSELTKEMANGLEYVENYKARKLKENGPKMSLHNEQNKLSFTLTSLGFASERENGEDDDWVDVRVKITQGENIFTSVGECLQAHELSSIKEWFTTLSKRRLPSDAILEFIEPEIKFHFLEQTRKWVLIMIELNCEFDSDFMPKQFHPDDFDWGETFDELLDNQDPFWYRDKLIFPLRKQDFVRIVSELEIILSELPDPLGVQEYQKKTNLPE